jgi:hypothetical protein
MASTMCFLSYVELRDDKRDMKVKRELLRICKRIRGRGQNRE